MKQEQLEILQQGVDAWNKWRAKNPDIRIQLEKTDLRNSLLMLQYFDDSDSAYDSPLPIDLRKVNFRNADLVRVNLTNSDLRDAEFSKSNLYKAQFVQSDLTNANICEATLHFANFENANLKFANFSGARLENAHFKNGALRQSNFSMAHAGETVFANVDLSTVIGLGDVIHHSPSSISTDTFIFSKGNIPDAFLRGCGLSDWEIESVKLYNPDLGNEEINKILYKMYDLRASQALQVSPLFISYNHNDSAFVDKLESSLSANGVRFWRDIHDMKSGKMEKQINRAIQLNPTVLVILSENSLQSDWVEHEVRTARALEKEMRRDVLCPVALDDGWKNSPWAKRIMEQIMEYNILDFSEWKDDTKFENTFNKLIDGLGLFYK